MSKHKIHNLDSLDLQIAELKNKQLLVEQQLENNWRYLKSDYGSIIRNTLFKRSIEEGRGSFIYSLLNIPEFKNAFGRTAEKLTIKAESLLVKLFDKLAN